MPSMCCSVFTSTRYWIWEINALAVLVVCLIAYLRRKSSGCSPSQQISASNCFATDTLIAAPDDHVTAGNVDVILQQQSHGLRRKGTLSVRLPG